MRNIQTIKAEINYISRNFAAIVACTRNDKGDTTLAAEALETLRQGLWDELLGVVA